VPHAASSLTAVSDQRRPDLLSWRAGLRIGEALDLAATDLHVSCGARASRQGRPASRGRDGSLSLVAAGCVASARSNSRTTARAGARRRFAPRQLRHAHAVEMAHEGVALVVIQRQLGHASLGSPRPICRGSPARRSSTRSTRGPRRPSRPAPAHGTVSRLVHAVARKRLLSRRRSRRRRRGRAPGMLMGGPSSSGPPRC
jgi:hypothetical protein